MITYELCVLTRVLPKTQLTKVLKRISDQIFETTGVIRNIESLGEREIPFKVSKDGQVHKRAHYIVMEFHAPPAAIEELNNEYNRDVDIVKQKIYKKNEEYTADCTLSEELQPAPYRKEVQELLEIAKKKEKPKYKYNTGLDYYPFQK